MTSLLGAALVLGLAAPEGPATAPNDDAKPTIRKPPWIKRWAPQRNLVEIGLHGGVFLPSDRHDFYDPITAPQKPLWEAGGDVGLRLAYFPLRFLGLETEVDVVPTRARTLTDDRVVLFMFRGHAIAQLPFWRVTPFLLGGYGLVAARSAPVVVGNDIDPVGHWGGGIKLFINRWLAARVDGRHLIGAKSATQQDTANHVLITAGLSVTLNRHKDRDWDGIPDKKDRCPDVPGERPHGCPVVKKPEPPPPADSDGDGFLDPDDACPNQPGIAPDGCPAKDSDGDGFLDPDDECPKEPETKNGFEDGDGCPDELPEKIKEFTGVIEGIQFEFRKADIRPDSRPLLDKAVEVLKEFPDIRVQIDGHTDNVGARDFNLELSRERAEAVRQYLIDGGVGEDRITTRGLGPDEPRETNDTEAGRAANRRIEFQIIRAP